MYMYSQPEEVRTSKRTSLDYLKTTDLAQVWHGGVTGTHPGPAHHIGGGALSVQHEPLGLTTRALTQQRVTRPVDTRRMSDLV